MEMKFGAFSIAEKLTLSKWKKKCWKLTLSLRALSDHFRNEPHHGRHACQNSKQPHLLCFLFFPLQLSCQLLSLLSSPFLPLFKCWNVLSCSWSCLVRLHFDLLLKFLTDEKNRTEGKGNGAGRTRVFVQCVCLFDKEGDIILQFECQGIHFRQQCTCYFCPVWAHIFAGLFPCGSITSSSLLWIWVCQRTVK